MSTNTQWTDGSDGSPGFDPTAIHQNIPAEISTIPVKSPPAAVDLVVIESVADGFEKRQTTVGDIAAAAALPTPDEPGQILYALTAAAFTKELPLINSSDAFILFDDNALQVVKG